MIQNNSPCVSTHSGRTRRDFLKTAGTVAAGLMTGPLAKAEAAPAVSTVPFGPYRVSRMIAGGNPISGYSHFNVLYSIHMLDYFTDERVVEFLQKCEKTGINTFQSSLHERFPRQYPKLRDAGSKIQWICLAAPYDVPKAETKTPEGLITGVLKCADAASKFKPIGMAHHGIATDRLWKAGKVDMIEQFIHKVHDLGYPAGISTHNPKVLEYLCSKEWGVDFFMCCFYVVSREADDYKSEIGVVLVGETYLSTDPPRMCNVIRQVDKTCLGFKILAAGRSCDSHEDLCSAFEFAYKNIKPIDATIVGMYPRYSDQISENVGIVRGLTS